MSFFVVSPPLTGRPLSLLAIDRAFRSYQGPLSFRVRFLLWVYQWMQRFIVTAIFFYIVYLWLRLSWDNNPKTFIRQFLYFFFFFRLALYGDYSLCLRELSADHDFYKKIKISFRQRFGINLFWLQTTILSLVSTYRGQ